MDHVCMAMLLTHECVCVVSLSRMVCSLQGTWLGANSHWRWRSVSIWGVAWAEKQTNPEVIPVNTADICSIMFSFFKIFYREWAFKICNKSEQIPAVTAVIPGCSSSCSLCWASPPPSLRRILRLGHTSCSPEHVCMKTSAPEHKITKWKKKLINAKWLVLWKDTFHLKHLKFTF